VKGIGLGEGSQGFGGVARLQWAPKHHQKERHIDPNAGESRNEEIGEKESQAASKGIQDQNIGGITHGQQK
jgi:hypothetical protein